MEVVKQTVELTAEEMAALREFQAEKQRKEAEEKRKQDRAAYAQLVDDSIALALPRLQRVSEHLAVEKREIRELFNEAISLKSELFGLREDDQQSHTFTSTDGTARVRVGYYVIDAYRDTVNEGIEMVKNYIEGLAKDDESRALVNAVMRLLAKDQKGTLKASRVLQLRKMAQDSGNERFIEGVRIIEEAYQPQISKQYIRADVRDEKTGEWRAIPLGMTEA